MFENAHPHIRILLEARSAGVSPGTVILARMCFSICSSLFSSHSCQTFALGAELLNYVAVGLPPGRGDALLYEHVYAATTSAAVDSAARLPVAQALIEGLVQTSERRLRNRGAGALRRYYERLAPELRQRMLLTLLASCPFDNVAYLLLTWLKDEMLQALQSDDVALQRVFLGPSLSTIFGVLTRLPPSGLERTLPDMTDRTLAVLNLLLLLLRYGPTSAERRVAADPTGVSSSFEAGLSSCVFTRLVFATDLGSGRAEYT